MPKKYQQGEKKICDYCEEPNATGEELCADCLDTSDETQYETVTLQMPRWAWSILHATLEAIASDDALDDATRHEIGTALPEIIETHLEKTITPDATYEDKIH